MNKMKRTGLGIGMGALVLLGVFLSQLLNLPGTGTTDPQATIESQADIAGELGPAETSSDSQSSEETASTKLSMMDSLKANDEVIKVWISDRTFRRSETDTTQAVAIEDIVSAVKAAQGSEEGIKLVVYLEESARASAQEELTNALNSAEIPETAILQVDSF